MSWPFIRKVTRGERAADRILGGSAGRIAKLPNSSWLLLPHRFARGEAPAGVDWVKGYVLPLSRAW